MDLLWHVTQPIPFNTGAPGRLADNILGISGIVYIYPTINERNTLREVLPKPLGNSN